MLIHWSMVYVDAILKMQFSNRSLLIRIFRSSYDEALLMIDRHWFIWLLDAIRQRIIVRAQINPVLCRHMASLGHNKVRLKRCAIVFAHNSYYNCQIFSQSTSLGQYHRVLWKMLKRFDVMTTEMYIMDEHDFARFELKINFGGISYIPPPPLNFGPLSMKQ